MPACVRYSGTGAAQCPGFSVRSGMAIGGRGSGLAAGCTLVKPTRRPPCHLAVLLPSIRQILSWIFSGRLLNTRPFLNVVALLVASLKPWLRETSSPTAWQWKVRGPRQEWLHQCDSFSSTTAEGRRKKVDTFMNKVVHAMLASDGISVKLKPGKSVFNKNLDGKKKNSSFCYWTIWNLTNLDELEIKLWGNVNLGNTILIGNVMANNYCKRLICQKWANCIQPFPHKYNNFSCKCESYSIKTSCSW